MTPTCAWSGHGPPRRSPPAARTSPSCSISSMGAGRSRTSYPISSCAGHWSVKAVAYGGDGAARAPRDGAVTRPLRSGAAGHRSRAQVSEPDRRKQAQGVGTDQRPGLRLRLPHASSDRRFPMDPPTGTPVALPRALLRTTSQVSTHSVTTRTRKATCVRSFPIAGLSRPNSNASGRSLPVWTRGRTCFDGTSRRSPMTWSGTFACARSPAGPPAVAD